MCAMRLPPRFAPLLLAALLSACSTTAPNLRHSAADLQRYQAADFSWPATSAEGELALRTLELDRLRARLAMPIGPESDAELPAALSAAMLFNAEMEPAKARLREALPRAAAMAPNAQRALLSAAHALDPSGNAEALKLLLGQLSTPREFAIASYALLRADASQASLVQQHLQARLATQADEPRLLALAQHLQARPAQPPLAELLNAPLLAGHPVVFSLQRADRRQRGFALVRGADGRFVRERDGRLLAIPQLALALSNLPGTISLGNTPQGLYTVVGSGTAATNPWIGPTPYLHAMLPVEADPATFFHGQALDPNWSEAQYERLLPQSWRQFGPFKEAWLAGRAGRNEILMHGSTVNPAYYAGSPFFPGTPTAGCLMTDERWDPATGRLLASDQLRLAKAFTRDGVERGFLVVVELPGDGPIDLNAVQALAP
jgi:hypothetical protein